MYSLIYHSSDVPRGSFDVVVPMFTPSTPPSVPLLNTVSPIYIREQMGGSSNPHSLSPDANRKPYKLTKKTLDSLNEARREGVLEM
jgi:hypothetical protein